MTQLSITAFALKTQTAMKYPPTIQTCTPQAKQSPTGNILAVAATTRISQWRHDAGVLGSLPFEVCGCSPRWFESTFSSEVAVGPLSLWVASPGDTSEPPFQ